MALNDRREFEAQILLRDPRTDLAILKVKSPNGGLTRWRSAIRACRSATS